MTEDILPPLPPGEKSAAKKEGFFSSFFKKKKQDNYPGSQDFRSGDVLLQSAPPAPMPTSQLDSPPQAPVISDVTLDSIRKQLGLDIVQDDHDDVHEPPRIMPKQDDYKTNLDRQISDWSSHAEDDISPLKKQEKIIAPQPSKDIDFTKDADEEVDEPSKIAPTRIMHTKIVPAKAAPIALPKVEPHKRQEPILSKKAMKKQKQQKPAPEPVAEAVKDDISEWTNFEHKAQEEKADSPFMKDVEPEEIKKLAKDIHRKKFEDKKRIKYEPELSEDEITREIRQSAKSFDHDMKSLETESLEPAPLLKKPLKIVEPIIVKEPVKDEMKDHDDNIMSADKIDFTSSIEIEEREPAAREVKQQEPIVKINPAKEAKLKKLQEKAAVANMHELRKEIESIIKDKIRDKVREEERAKLDKELTVERDKLKKERQAVEQEKIAVAGNSNKLDFREKHLAQARTELEHDRYALRKERAQFESDEKEHQELVKKLPMMRKDYEKLKDRMVAFGDKIKLNTRLEENIARREKALADAQRHLDEMESRIKKDGFSGYLETEISGQSFISKKLSQGDILKEKNPELYALVDDCRSSIWRNQLSHAKEAYMKLRGMYHSAKMSDAERELLYTTIRELYDDITLASMGSE
ncbi:MAG: hypothetical protein V1866_06510 [archaeon]